MKSGLLWFTFVLQNSKETTVKINLVWRKWTCAFIDRHFYNKKWLEKRCCWDHDVVFLKPCNIQSWKEVNTSKCSLNPAGDWTLDLRFTRPTPYHLATEPVGNDRLLFQTVLPVSIFQQWKGWHLQKGIHFDIIEILVWQLPILFILCVKNSFFLLLTKKEIVYSLICIKRIYHA